MHRYYWWGSLRQSPLIDLAAISETLAGDLRHWGLMRRLELRQHRPPGEKSQLHGRQERSEHCGGLGRELLLGCPLEIG